LNAWLVVLIFASFLLALPPVLWRLRRGRALRTRATVRALGAGQLVLGGFWVLWGALYLGGHGRREAAGWYAVVFGLLWCWQALRRLLPGGRR
jgi:hypothetical protein